MIINPEFLKYFRIQCRSKRLLAIIIPTVVITIIVSFLVWESNMRDLVKTGRQIFFILIFVQFAIFYLFGSYQTSTSISKEKEQKTYNFQKITKLTAVDLLLGKLFGSPLIAYVFLATTIPLSLIAAIMGDISWQLFLGSYAFLLISGIMWHSFGLLNSSIAEKSTVFIPVLMVISILSFESLSNAYKGFLMFSPFTVVRSLFREEIRLTVFYGLKINNFFFTMGLMIYITYWSLNTTVKRVKQDMMISVNRKAIIYFLITLEVLILGMLWIPDNLHKIVEHFLVVNMTILFIAVFLLARRRSNLQLWIRERRLKKHNWLFWLNRHAPPLGPFIVIFLIQLAVLFIGIVGFTLFVDRGSSAEAWRCFFWGELEVFCYSVLVLAFIQFCALFVAKRYREVAFFYLVVYHLLWIFALVALTLPAEMLVFFNPYYFLLLEAKNYLRISISALLFQISFALIFAYFTIKRAKKLT